MTVLYQQLLNVTDSGSIASLARQCQLLLYDHVECFPEVDLPDRILSAGNNHVKILSLGPRNILGRNHIGMRQRDAPSTICSTSVIP